MKISSQVLDNVNELIDSYLKLSFSKIQKDQDEETNFKPDYTSRVKVRRTSKRFSKCQ